MPIILKVKIIPCSKQNEIVGFIDDWLKVKIKAKPEKGKANKELIKFLVQKFNIAQDKIKIMSGLTKRNKVLKLDISEQDFSKLAKFKKQEKLL